MATFFGEVREVSSRAVWWSDEEDDEDEDYPSEALISKGANLKWLAPDLAAFEGFLSKCNRLFVTEQKHEKFQRFSLIASVVSNDNKDEKSSLNLCSLYELEGSNYWLVFNTYFAMKQYHNVQFGVEFVQKRVLVHLKPTTLIINISCQTETERIQYLLSRSDGIPREFLDEVAKVASTEPFLAPATVRGAFALSLLERSVIFKWNLVCLVLPVAHDHYEFVPKAVANSGNEFRTLAYSNIIT